MIIWWVSLRCTHPTGTAGAVAGGLSAAVSGGDIVNSVVQGAVVGAVGGSIFKAIGKPTQLWSIPAYGAAGAGLSLLSGEKPEVGLLIAAGAAASTYSYDKIFNVPPDGRVATKDAIMERPTDISWHLDPAHQEVAVFGSANTEGFFSEKNLQWIAKNIPTGNQIAHVHDPMVELFPKSLQKVVLVPTMPISAAYVWAGTAAWYSPMTAPIALTVKYDQKK